MPWNTATPVLIWAVFCIPLSVLMWFFRPKDKLTNFLAILDYFLANLYCFLCINWVIVNYWLRFLPIIFTIILIVRFIIKEQRLRFLPRRSLPGLALLLVSLLALPVVVFFNVRAFLSLREWSYHDQPALLAFPLRTGLHATLNGGDGLNGAGMNNYYQDWLGRKTGSGQDNVYALDVVKMTLEGHIGNGILPGSYNDYTGFLELVYSPCIGTVDYVEDDHPEVKPFAPGAGLGNLIVINCVGNYITLSNLRHGSITVKPGDKVDYRRIIAMVGNTADRTFPHLHIQAARGGRDGQPMPMLFEGFETINRFIVRNDLTLR